MFAFYSFKLNFGNSMSGTGLRGCLLVPAASASIRSYIGECTASGNGNKAVWPQLAGSAHGRQPAGSEQACPQYLQPSEWEQRPTGGLAHFPCSLESPTRLLGNQIWKPLQGTGLMAQEDPTVDMAGVCMFLCKPHYGLCVSPTQRPSIEEIESRPAFCISRVLTSAMNEPDLVFVYHMPVSLILFTFSFLLQ